MKFLIILFLLPFSGIAQFIANQEAYVDSIKQVIKTAKHDTTVVNAWIAWDNVIYVADPELDFKLNLKIDSLSSLNLEKKLTQNEKAVFLKAKGFALNGIGTVYNIQGDFNRAIDYYSRSLKIQEEIGNKGGVAAAYNNIGIIYLDQGETDKALEHYTNSLEIYKEIEDKNGIGRAFNNIGNTYKVIGNSAEALANYTQSLTIFEELDNQIGIASILTNIAVIYGDLGEYNKALDYHAQGLKIHEEIGNERGVALSLISIGNIYLDQGEIKNALDYSERSLTLSQEIGFALGISEAANVLWRVNKDLGRYKESLEMHELHISTRDSIQSEDNQKAVIQQEYKYAYEKQAAADSIKTAEANKVQDALLLAEKAENKQYQQFQYFLYVVLFLAVLFGGIIFNRFKLANKQKAIIEEQKHKVDEAYFGLEEAHKEITDSINYAERIQRSFLASKDLLDNSLNEYFVYFNPKEAVSGDFFWAGELSNGDFGLCCADSTGHGVPGAIMSILNISSIEKAVEKGLNNPADIFNLTRQLIIERLKKDGSEDGGKDGMDASFISLNPERNKMSYVTANNPIWMIRKGELIEIKGEKMPVGKHELDHNPFIGGELSLEKGDLIYILTDGFQDQFGGEKGKKYKVKPFKDLLLENANRSVDQQQQFIAKRFEDWKGSFEQVDDVCVIGVRV